MEQSQYRPNYIWIFITQVKGQIPEGYLFSPYVAQYISFQGEGELFFLIDDILTASGSLSRSFHMRSGKKQGRDKPDWLKGILLETPDFQLLKHVPKSVCREVVLNIMYCYHASWQGKLSYTSERSVTMSFRSALELLLLMREYYCLEE